jgi:hypothetical protein
MKWELFGINLEELKKLIIFLLSENQTIGIIYQGVRSKLI